MEKEHKEFSGELGEVIEPFMSITATDGEERHAVVGFEVNGFCKSENGDIVLLFSPQVAKELAEEIMKVAEESNIANYNLLKHKAPF